MLEEAAEGEGQRDRCTFVTAPVEFSVVDPVPWTSGSSDLSSFVRALLFASCF